MYRSRTVLGGECARSMLAQAVLLFCIGWILNLGGHNEMVVAAPVIDRNNEPNVPPRVINIKSHEDNVIAPPAADSLTETIMDHNGDKLETDGSSNTNTGTLPEIVLPDNILKAMQQGENSNLPKNETEEDCDDDEHTVDNEHNHHVFVVMEYQPNLVLRCAAKGTPKPNVTWEYEDGHFSHYVISNSMTHGYVHSGGEDDNTDKVVINVQATPQQLEEAWVDLKLPKLNNAFYGTLRCRADNVNGNVTYEVKLIHNANSSALMKVVRCVLSALFLLVAVLVVKGIQWANKKRHDRLYARLPPQDLEIINKFKKGLEPPPPSPCSSMIVQESTAKALLDGATSCVKGIEITISGGENDNDKMSGMKGAYRPVKQGSSSPELQQRARGGMSTPCPSTCSSGILDTVNSWTNYVPYDDKMETSSRHFKVDFLKIIEHGCYGTMYAGKVRNDLTMEWSSMAVKSGNEDEDNNFMLEHILTELKILASLPKLHDNIVNLRGAYTKMLHKRQAFVFVDFCEHGTLASFIDLNRETFQEWPMKMEELQQSQEKVGNEPGASSSKPSANTEIYLKTLFTWAWQIADGMNFLHKNRVIHGNLSTSNIYVSSNLKVKVGNIGYPSMGETSNSSYGEISNKNWLTAPHYNYEQFSKQSDIWDYGRVIFEIFSLREQQCPDNARIVDFMHVNGPNGEDDDDLGEDEGLEIPQYASAEIFELMLCCWNDNATLSPEFDFFVKTLKKLYRELLIKTENNQQTN